jgi:hypothetical protein
MADQAFVRAKQDAERACLLGWKVQTLPAPDFCEWNNILKKTEVTA